MPAWIFRLYLYKDTALRFVGERGNLQFLADAFNIFNFNRTNLLHPSTTAVYAGNRDVEPPLPTTGIFLSPGGIYTSGANYSRQIQLELRLSFRNKVHGKEQTKE